MITPVTRKYPSCPRATDIQFFTDADAFLNHARDHFLSPDEPWDWVFHRGSLAKLCRKINAGDVSAIEQLYGDAVMAIDKGIGFSLGQPVYAVLLECAGRPTTCWRTQLTHMFLTRDGFVVVVGDGIVRTAYFVCDTPGTSNFTLFKNGWKSIADRCAKKRHVDMKHGTVSKRIRANLCDKDHWDACVNPHLKPKKNRTDRARRADDVQ